MNRLVIIIVLLNMFLSCGNSSTSAVTNKISERPKVVKNYLSKEQIRISERLDSLFTRMNQSGLFNGSVLVSKAGKVLYQKSLGIQNKQTREALSDSSMFQLASVSKVITATAVLMLHERDLVDINRPFQFYFPDFPYDKIRVKDLMDHRSGLPNYLYTLNTLIYKPNYQMTNEDMYSFFISKKARPYLKPDTRFNYCNTNYALLALLVEKISQKSFSQFLKEELFIPLGMKNTATILDINLDGANVTKPYDLRWKPVKFDASDYVLGDKSLYSTPYDLFLFSEALYQNKIIKEKTQQLAYTAFSKENKLGNYGYGWRMKDFKDPVKKEVYHNGWWHGYRSSFHRRLSDTLTVIILSNQLNKLAYQTSKVYEILDKTSIPQLGEDEE